MTCPAEKWTPHPCEPTGCPTPGACSASKGIEELRAKLNTMSAILTCLLDHYLGCYGGNFDALAEVMARAAYMHWLSLHVRDDTPPEFAPCWEYLGSVMQAEHIDKMRAALRALAAMSLPPAVLYAARGVYDGDNHDEGVAVVTRAVFLAAADEGETPS